MVCGSSEASTSSRAAVSSSASSQPMRRNLPSPFLPARFMGSRRRSGAQGRSKECEALVQSVPSVNGIVGSPWIFVAMPSSTVTSIAQVSGQSCGQATWTVLVIASLYVDEFYPMPHRRRGAALQVREAAYVRCRDERRPRRLQRGELARAQLAGNDGLRERIGAGGAAAKMPVVHRCQLVARLCEQRFDVPTHLLPVLQRAGRLERNLAARGTRRDSIERNDFGQVASERRDALRLLRVGRILRKQVAILLHGDAAAARRDYDRLHFTALDVRPPLIDQGAHVVAPFLLVVQMEAQPAATAGAGSFDERDAHAIEHARRCCIDGRGERGLHATGEREHLARVTRRGPCASRASGRRYFGFQRGRKEGPRQATKDERGRKEFAARQAESKSPPLRALQRRAPRFRLHYCTPNVDEASITHARRTGGLAGTAGEAAVEVQPGFLGHRRAFERALHEIDAPARAVEVVAQYLVGGAGRGAEAAMHALAQDRFGLPAFGRVADEIGELGLHRSLYFSHEGDRLVRLACDSGRHRVADPTRAPAMAPAPGGFRGAARQL